MAIRRIRERVGDGWLVNKRFVGYTPNNVERDYFLA